MTRARNVRRGRGAAHGWLRVALVLLAIAAAPAGAGEAGTMDAVSAYREANRLLGVNRLRDSLPYFRRALSQVTTDFCEIHYYYGVALGARSMQYAPRAGGDFPATRSSVERIALAAESLRQLTRAAELARDPAAGSSVRRYRSEVLTAWGFPWEALSSLEEAERAIPGNGWAGKQHARYVEVMRDATAKRFAPDSLAGPAPLGADGRRP